MAVPPQPIDRRVRLRQRQCAQHARPQFVRRKRRPPLLQPLDLPPRRADRRRTLNDRLRFPRATPLAAPRRLRVPWRTQFAGAQPPDRLQLLAVRLRLAPPRVQHRLLHPRRRVLFSPVRQPLQRFRPPRRETGQQLLAVARDLEPGHVAHVRRRGRVTQRLQPLPQLLAVVGSDQPLRPLQRRELGAAPRPLRIARHVGDHAMRVQLRIQVAARHVPERRGHHPVRLHPRTPPRRPVVAAGHQEFRLDEAQRGAHRLVVRLDHPRPRARAGVD